MKTIFQVIAVLAIVHVLLAIGLIGWLAGTDRLDRQRVVQTVDLFRLTLAEQEQISAEDLAKADQLRVETERQSRLSGLGGTASAADRLVQEQERNELLLRQLERTRRDIQSLSDNLMLTRQRMDRQKTELVTAREELEQRLQEIESRMNDDGFKKAVALYEQLPGKQVKQMFEELMNAGQTEQVVTYLEAMQPRKAASILKEFGGDASVGRAVELTERLRTRGSELVKNVEQTG